MKRLLLSLTTALALSIVACSSADDALNEAGTEEIGESEDGLSGLSLREIKTFSAPSFATASENRKLFTSASQFSSYFGQKVPAGVDFSKEWLVFYATGPKKTGGYSAKVTRARVEDRELILSTRLEQPGEGCPVTQSLTSPSTLVAIARPVGAKWYRFTRYTKTNKCEVAPALSCAVMLCGPGTQCIEDNGVGECVPSPGCAALTCQVGTYCYEEKGAGQCLPYSSCLNVKCTATTHCVDKPIQCIKAPCPPTAPECVPN